MNEVEKQQKSVKTDAQSFIGKFGQMLRDDLNTRHYGVTHNSAKSNVCKWLCSDGKTWSAGDRATDTWVNCKDESEADEVVKSMQGLSAPQIKAA